MDTEQHRPLRSTVAILSRGDAAARADATPQNSRFVRVFEALAAIGIEARPVIYDETFADAVRDQLLSVDGVLVWVDPIHQGKTRVELDPLLRELDQRADAVRTGQAALDLPSSAIEAPPIELPKDTNERLLRFPAWLSRDRETDKKDTAESPRSTAA